MKQLDALGDPNRRAILQFLSAGELSASDIVDRLRSYAAISQPAVSQHLKALREANLVAVRAEGTRRLYSLDPAGIENARAWLGALLDPLAGLAQPLDALATEVSRGKRDRDRARRRIRRDRGSGEAVGDTG